MLNLKEMLSHMGEDQHKDKELECLILKYLRMLDDDDYKKLLHEVFIIVNDGHFTESMAKYAVSKMKNVNGTTGETLDMPTIEHIIKQGNLNVHKYDFYYVINMMYSDYSNVFGNNASLYVNSAIAYLSDPDAKSGRALRQYFHEAEE